MLKKATFFVLQPRYTNALKVTIPNRNSYPYYQDKKEKHFYHKKRGINSKKDMRDKYV